MSQSTVISFDREFDDITAYWQKIAAPFKLSMSTFIDIKNSFSELIVLQKNAHERLNDFALTLDSVSFSNEITVNSEAYAALRHFKDTLEVYYDLLWHDHKNHNQHSKGASRWWTIIYFLSSSQAYSTRKKLMKAVKRQKCKVGEILRKADIAISASSSKFVTLDADTLWQNRCKAYEYIL
ncbi:hypothetical protein GCM10028818_60100 [Spirosoma horti]